MLGVFVIRDCGRETSRASTEARLLAGPGGRKRSTGAVDRARGRARAKNWADDDRMQVERMYGREH